MSCCFRGCCLSICDSPAFMSAKRSNVMAQVVRVAMVYGSQSLEIVEVVVSRKHIQPPRDPALHVPC